MAKAHFNPAIGGLRGKVDGWVYRQQNGETVVSAPREAKKTKPTAAQRGRRDRFRAAQAYAAEVLADPLKRLAYQKLGAERKRPPNVLLISNFLTPPTIDRVDREAYTGKRDQPIRVLATDAIEVTAVTVSIRTPAGTLIESGPATPDHGIWTYRTTANAGTPTPQIEITARNRAGAEARQITH